MLSKYFTLNVETQFKLATDVFSFQQSEKREEKNIENKKDKKMYQNLDQIVVIWQFTVATNNESQAKQIQ